MVDRLVEFYSLSGQGPGAFPLVPSPLWEAVHHELSPQLQQRQQHQQLLLQQQNGTGLAFKFLVVACRCHKELSRVQQQLHRRNARSFRGVPKDAPGETAAATAAAARQRVAAAAAAHEAEEGFCNWDNSASSGAAEVAQLLRCVRQQQENARELETLAEDLSDLQALQLLRQQQKQQKEVDMRDARAHRHAILRCLYTAMQDVTGELQRREAAALKQQMECSRYFSAVAAVGSGNAMGGFERAAGAAAVEAAEAAGAAMLQKRMETIKKAGGGPRQRFAAAAAEEEADHHHQQQDADSTLLLADERQLVVTLNADSTDTVVSIQRKLQEIVQAMNVFAFKVAEQAEACYEIGSLADAALTNIQGAEKQLGTALNRHSKFRLYLVYAFVGMGLFVLFLDFCKSSRPYLI